MTDRRKHLRLPSVIAAGSLVALLTFASFTSPVDNVSYGLIFFATSLVFLISVGHVIAYLRWGQVTPRGRARILTLSILLVVVLMLRSSGSLNILEALALILIGVGLWFYSGRRSV